MNKTVGALPLTTLLLCVAACHSDEKACTLLGCESQVTVERPLSLAPAGAEQLVYEVCRNDDCASTHLEWQSGGAEFTCSMDDVSVPLRGLVHCRLTPNDWRALSDAGPASSTPFAFTFIGLARANADDLKDGDRYTFKLSRAGTGEVLFDASGAVSYETLLPNGPGCSPTCKVAKLP